MTATPDLVDVHAHLAPIDAPRLAALPGVSWSADTETLVLDGHKVGIRDLFHPERLIARMDRHGVARAWVSIPPPLYRQSLPAAQALDWARYLNATLLECTRASGGRLGALLWMPLEHPSLLPALQADFDAGGYEGVAVAAGGHPSIVYADAAYQPLWAWMDARAAFVFVHPGTCADPRLGRFYMENLVGNPVETGVAAAHLILAGVPGRFPGIRFCLAHAGGILSTLVGRLERGFDTKRPDVDLAVERPLQAVRRFYVDGIAHQPGLMSLVRTLHGDDRVLYGSDWPFPMGLDH